MRLKGGIKHKRFLNMYFKQFGDTNFNKATQKKQQQDMTRLFQLTVLLFLLITSCQTKTNKIDLLRSKITQIVSAKNVLVGVSIIGNNGKDTLSLHGDRHFPMQSVFKFHIALAVLAEVDKGKLSLNQKINITKEELLPEDFWSPLRDENPNGGSFTIERLIQYSVSHSDNTACDVLINLIGTPKTVEEYIKKSGIGDIQITFNEAEMQAKWENMFQNWTTPKAASQTLRLFYENKSNLLSKGSYDFFWRTNKETTTGKNRIKGQLPDGTIVAHKTGWSGTNKETGITAAVNNIGIVFLPNGEYFIISVFVSESKEDFDTNEKIIADIAKATYDYYTAPTK
jgi:beta-lactamase class A